MGRVHQVKDNQTGQILQIPEEQLGQYGIAAPQVAPAGQAPQQVQGANASQYITGHSLEQHQQALQQARLAGDAVGMKQIQSDYDKEYQYQKDFSKPNAQTQKNLDSYNKVQNFINVLENHYQQAGGASFGEGPMARILGALEATGGKAGLNSEANTFERQKAGFAATLKSITGDTGVLTQKDYERLAGLVPDLGSTPDEAKNLFSDLRQQLAASFQKKAEKTGINPQHFGTHTGNRIADTLTANPIVKLLGLTSPINTAQDIGTGIRTGRELPGLQQQIKQAETLEKQSRGVTDPKQKKALLQQANQIRNSASGELGNLTKSFSPDINQPYLERAVTGATSIATTADLANLLNFPAMVKNVKGATGGRLTSKATLGAAREEAAKNATIDTKPLLDAGEKYVKNIDPGASKAWETLKPAIQESTTATDLLEKLSNWGNKAFTKSGDKRAITEGLLKAHLYEAGRDTIKDQAPEIAQLTTKLGNRIGFEKLLGFLGKGAAGGLASGAGFALLYSLLGRRGGGGGE